MHATDMGRGQKLTNNAGAAFAKIREVDPPKSHTNPSKAVKHDP